MSDDTPLPPSIQRLLPRLTQIMSTASRQQAADFKPCSTDILLTTGMKSGTTWVEQVLQGLRSGGNMNFEEICLVIPCLENAFDAGITNLYAPQTYPPQLFQTHLERKDTPMGFGKHIVVVRDPVDSAVSMYHFIVNWMFTEEELSLDEFVEWFVAKECVPEFPFTNPTQTRHMIGWYPHRLDDDVLWLHYEDLIVDLQSCIKLISDFVGLGVGDQELLDLVEKQSSLEFMVRYRHQFDSHVLKMGRNEAMGLPKDAGIKDNPGKVRNGKANQGRATLSPHVWEKVEQMWAKFMGPVTGYSTYKQMRAAINKELGRTLGQPES